MNASLLWNDFVNRMQREKETLISISHFKVAYETGQAL